jgi:hypothetical protein
MWYAATVNAFDLIDQVHVSAVVRCHAASGEETTVTVWQGSATVAGVGEGDPLQWLSDALVALLETL